ncbi:MAG: hypothetical protein J5903_03920 [Clostridia bacterium]|nr:hypothetical protein [Clostridia bacterium]
MKYYEFQEKTQIKINGELINPVVQEMAERFLYRLTELSFVSSDGLFASAGNVSPAAVPTVTEKGIYIPANSVKQLIDRLFFVLDKAEAYFDETGKRKVRIKAGEYLPKDFKGEKMIHLCVFPETKFFVLKRAIRLAGALGFTHVVLEFWGTYPYKCLPELKWKGKGLTDEQVKDLIAEIRSLKMQPVPMINHFGHASGSRFNLGKHVVLDKDISLSPYFINHGWVWNFKEPEVKKLLREMRAELAETFGEGEYFHIGFDESYYWPKDENELDEIYKYVSAICAEIKAEGRRPVLWGDLFLNVESAGVKGEKGYFCNAATEEIAEKMLASLPKYAIVADWHYGVAEYPWKTSVYLKERGYDVLECPWYSDKNVASAIQTAESEKTLGIMLTTWHFLSHMADGMSSIIYAGKLFGGESIDDWIEKFLVTEEFARKVYGAEDYSQSGWVEEQVKDICD